MIILVGASASGKTEVAKRLKQLFGTKKLSHIQQDLLEKVKLIMLIIIL